MKIEVLGSIFEFDAKTCFKDSKLQAHLNKAHQNGGIARCLCNKMRPILQLRQYQSGFSVARMPGSGITHDERCQLFETSDSYSRLLSAYSTNAILIDNGKIKIALNIGQTEASDYVSFGDLINIFILFSGSNRFDGSTLNQPWWKLRQNLESIATKIHANGRPLIGMLYCPPVFSKSANEANTNEFYERLTGNNDELLVIGKISSIRDSQYGVQIKFKHMPNVPFWYSDRVSNKVIEVLSRSNEQATTNIKSDIFAIAFIKKTKGNAIKIIDIAFIRTLLGIIPCYSTPQYELYMRLAESGISFTASIKFERPEAIWLEDANMHLGAKDVPAFILTDHGATSERRLAKITALKDEGRDLWLWDIPSKSGNMPPLPSH
jgi:hypothetical protein